MAAKAGTVVNADFGDGPTKGVIIGTAGDKELVIPMELVHKLGYREPEDRDAGGSGLTWWNA